MSTMTSASGQTRKALFARPGGTWQRLVSTCTTPLDYLHISQMSLYPRFCFAWLPPSPTTKSRRAQLNERRQAYFNLQNSRKDQASKWFEHCCTSARCHNPIFSYYCHGGRALPCVWKHIGKDRPTSRDTYGSNCYNYLHFQAQKGMISNTLNKYNTNHKALNLNKP